MLNGTMFRSARLYRHVPAALAVAVWTCTAAPAVACDKEKGEVRTIVRVDDSGVDPAIQEQVARLSQQLDGLQAELEGVREAIAEMGGVHHRGTVRMPGAPPVPHAPVMPSMPSAPPMPAMPPMPPQPHFDWGRGPGADDARAEWHEEMRDWQGHWREAQEELADQWQAFAQEWRDREQALRDEWQQRQEEWRDRARETAERAGKLTERSERFLKQRQRSERNGHKNRERRAAESAERERAVYGVEGKHADELYDLLAPSDVRVVVSRAGEHIAVRGTEEEHEVLNAGLQLLGWIERDDTFARMTEGKRVEHRYKVGKKRAGRLFGMLAPNDVRVVVSHAGDNAVSVSGTKREHEVLRAFLDLLHW